MTDKTGLLYCLEAIRDMILDGSLLPGQKVHQAEIAARLGISRIPVREALSTLQAEGILEHRPNVGFTVSRFSGEDLSEIYLMRRVLENELFRSVPLASVDVMAMERINHELTVISAAEDPDSFQRTNQKFHFMIFDQSPLELVRQEVVRLWYMSSFYRGLYMSEVKESLHVQEDHVEIIKALRNRDLDALIEASEAHRHATEALIVERLGRTRPR
jgi:DNA-binding GntR family transcriptional regulator